MEEFLFFLQLKNPLMLLFKKLFPLLVSFLSLLNIFLSLLMFLKTKLTMFFLLLFFFFSFEFLKVLFVFFDSHFDFIFELFLFFVDLSDFSQILLSKLRFDHGSFERMRGCCTVFQCGSAHFDGAFHELDLMKFIKDGFLFFFDFIELRIDFTDLKFVMCRKGFKFEFFLR